MGGHQLVKAVLVALLSRHLHQPKVVDNVEVAQRTLALGEQPVVDAGPVEGVGAGQAPDLLADLEAVQADGALLPLLVSAHHPQGHAAQGFLGLPP